MGGLGFRVLACGCALLAFGASFAANAAATQMLPAAARGSAPVIEDYGSFVVTAANESTVAEALPSTVHARGHVFDPAQSDPLRALPDARGRFDSLEAAGGDFIVQFDAPIRAEWLQQARAAGLQPVQYLPHRAYLMHGGPAAARALATHPRVRHVGPWQPAFRLAPSLAWAYGQPDPDVPAYGIGVTADYDLALSKLAPPAAFEALLLGKGGSLQHRLQIPGGSFDLWRVRMPGSAVAEIARLPGVLALDPHVVPVAEDERSAQIVAGNFVSTTELDPPGYDPLLQFGVDGSGVTIALSDDGIGIPGDGGYYLWYTNAINGPLRGASPGADGHGHLSATIIAGRSPLAEPDTLGYNYGLGVAPGAALINIPFLRLGYTGTELDAADDSVQSFGPNDVRATITNNSWGAGGNGNHYDAYAAMYDALVRDASSGPVEHPLLVVFSAGNDGAAGLTRPKMAKNVISVGASENLRPEYGAFGGFGAGNDLDDIPLFSSRGPAADGRVKPDIVAPGEAVSGGRAGTSLLAGNIDLYHRYGSGTSHAAPQISAAAALYTQAWQLTHGGARPSPAMIKAALLNAAVEMDGEGSAAPIPNGREGWGRINLQRLLDPGLAKVGIDQGERFVDVGAIQVWNGRVVDPDRELRIALAWTDVPGLTDPALVNDLDLVVDVGETQYRGNVFADGVSVEGGSADRVNNVEKLLLPAGLPAGTPITVSIQAIALNGDGVPGNSERSDQDYALSCLNCEAVPAFTLTVAPQIESLCMGETLVRGVGVAPLLGFATPVELAVLGSNAATFMPNPVAPASGYSELRVDTTGFAPGVHVLTVEALADGLQRQASFPIFVADALPAAPEVTSPVPAQLAVELQPTFRWTAVDQAFDYRVEIAVDAQFASPIASMETRMPAWTIDAPLAPDTVYYWRVFARNHCAVQGSELFADGLENLTPGASSIPSATASFTTRAAPPAPGT